MFSRTSWNVFAYPRLKTTVTSRQFVSTNEETTSWRRMGSQALSLMHSQTQCARERERERWVVDSWFQLIYCPTSQHLQPPKIIFNIAFLPNLKKIWVSQLKLVKRLCCPDATSVQHITTPSNRQWSFSFWKVPSHVRLGYGCGLGIVTGFIGFS
jgi:hypothetical protein